MWSHISTRHQPDFHHMSTICQPCAYSQFSIVGKKIHAMLLEMLLHQPFIAFTNLMARLSAEAPKAEAALSICSTVAPSSQSIFGSPTYGAISVLATPKRHLCGTLPYGLYLFYILCIYIYICIYTMIYIYIYNIHIYVYIYIICVSMYIYIYIYIYR